MNIMVARDDIIVEAIKEKKYKNIPQWVMENVSLDIFKRLALDVFYNSDYTIDHLIFFNTLINYCQFNQSALIDSVDEFGCDTPYVIFATMISGNYNWKRFMKKISKRNIDSSRIIEMIKAQFYFYHRIPKQLVLYILKTIDSLSNRDAFISGIILNLCSRSILELDENELIMELFDLIRSMNHKFYWVDTVYSLTNIWENGIPYYKEEFDDDFLFEFMMRMSNTLRDKNHFELPDSITNPLKRVIADDSYSFDDKKIMYDCIVSLSKVNINHIRFLKPFTKILHPYNDVYSLLEDVHSCYNGPVLRDYSYLDGILKSYDNDKMQLQHIRTGGGIQSLIEDKRSALYTEDGVVAALTYSKPQDIIDMLNEDDIFDIVKEDIIGHYDFNPVIHNLCATISDIEETGKIGIAKMLIRAKYNLATIAMNSPDCVNYGTMIDVSMPVAYSMVEDRPQLVSVLRFDLLTYDQLLRIVNHKKSYVPINTDRGIDCILLPTLEMLVDSSIGYLCDIGNKELGNIILRYKIYNYSQT